MTNTDNDASYGSDYRYIPATSISSGLGIEVLPDLFNLTIQVVNIQLVGDPKKDNFVLIDAGMPNSADEIISATEDRFGKNTRPKAIILTHGHFDHVGAIIELIKKWEVPVFAHKLELPYLTGQRNYPEPDPTVEGGMIAKMSSMFPNDSINISEYVQPLPIDGNCQNSNGFTHLDTRQVMCLYSERKMQHY